MIHYKSDKEIELIRQSCLLVCDTLSHVAQAIRPGMTGVELDGMAESFIRDHGGEPAFKGYRGFPSTLCISLNEEVVHGIPSAYEFREDDIISLDCGVLMNGFYGDSAYTFAMRDIDERVEKLLAVTLQALYLGISEAVAGQRIGDVGFAIQNFVERENRFGVVRALVGHGIGKNLHEPPEVPNFGKRGRGAVMKKGLVIAVEPMVNMGTKQVRQLSDGWTIVSRDRSPSAHFEHTIAITNGEAELLSSHFNIEEAVKNNSNLKEISIKN